jgi:hypothetical protein
MNKSTRISIAAIGTIFGFSGMDHGFFEILQGNQPTAGSWISAIGPAHKMWEHGNETAFTLIHNYLFTGIIAILVGLAIIIWSLAFVHKKHGALVLMSLFGLLLVTGGGVAQILFLPWIWLGAANIHSPLSWWRKILPARLRASLSKCWSWSLPAFSAIMIIVLILGITGFIPFVSNAETVLTVMLVCLGFALLLLPLTFLSGFARDIELNPLENVVFSD